MLGRSVPTVGTSDPDRSVVLAVDAERRGRRRRGGDEDAMRGWGGNRDRPPSLDAQLRAG
jgi:hypothetical protein